MLPARRRRAPHRPRVWGGPAGRCGPAGQSGAGPGQRQSRRPVGHPVIDPLPAWLPWLLPALAGPFAGSLLGVLVRRLPAGRPVGLARSACESCGRRLGPAELVPLLSYAGLGGRCRSCRAPIGRFHPAIELAATLVALWAVVAAPDPATAWAHCLLGWALLALAWIDAGHWRLPDALTLPLVPLGLAATWALEPWRLLDHALGAGLGYGAFRLVALAYRAWRGREGLGRGDAKLLAAAGAWVGWEGLSATVLLAALAALAFAGLLRLRGRAVTAGTALPFGPFLALGTWVVRLHGG